MCAALFRHAVLAPFKERVRMRRGYVCAVGARRLAASPLARGIRGAPRLPATFNARPFTWSRAFGARVASRARVTRVREHVNNYKCTCGATTQTRYTHSHTSQSQLQSHEIAGKNSICVVYTLCSFTFSPHTFGVKRTCAKISALAIMQKVAAAQRAACTIGDNKYIMYLER